MSKERKPYISVIEAIEQGMRDNSEVLAREEKALWRTIFTRQAAFKRLFVREAGFAPKRFVRVALWKLMVLGLAPMGGFIFLLVASIAASQGLLVFLATVGIVCSFVFIWLVFPTIGLKRCMRRVEEVMGVSYYGGNERH